MNDMTGDERVECLFRWLKSAGNEVQRFQNGLVILANGKNQSLQCVTRGEAAAWHRRVSKELARLLVEHLSTEEGLTDTDALVGDLIALALSTTKPEQTKAKEEAKV